MHNTSSEAFTFYDLERLPDSQRSEFEEIRALIEQAGDRDAHERCRRFESAPLTLSLAAARRPVEGPAADLAPVRPPSGRPPPTPPPPLPPHPPPPPLPPP